MHRIQVQLTQEQERVLREMARRAALALIGAFSDAPDVSRRHDDYLADAVQASLPSKA